jgi:hypothetical protein
MQITVIAMKPAFRFLAKAVVMGASAFTLEASVSPTILSPQPNAIIANTLSLNVSVSSTYELSTVTATLGALVTNLVYNDAGSWTNALDTTDLVRGSYTLTVTAQDVFGSSGQTQRVIRVDRPPVLNVIAPVNGSVATPNIFVSVTASDDDPVGVRIIVYNGFSPLFTGTNTVERFFPGFAGTLRIEAVDSSGQRTVKQRTIYVEPSTNLVEAISAPGPLLDFSGTRLLYASLPDPPEPPRGRLLDLSSGLAINAPEFWFSYPFPGQYFKPTLGWVSAESAVLAYQGVAVSGAFTVALQETNFFVISPAPGYDPPEKAINGVCIIGPTLFDFRKSTNGCSPYLGQCSACQSAYFYRDLAPNEIVFADTNGVFRSRPSDPMNVCSPRAIDLVSSKTPVYNPMTDGTNVVFQWATNIVANVNGADELLAGWASPENMQYRVNGGWVAFTRPGTVRQQHVWTRSPVGQFEQRTFFGVSSHLESLNDDGSLTFQVYNQGGPPVGRYLSMPAAQPAWINSGQGQVKWEAGIPYVIIGRSAFRVVVGDLSVHTVSAQMIGLELRSPNGLRFAIQESSDLFAWSNKMIITNLNGVFSLSNININPPSKFYRAVLRP